MSIPTTLTLRLVRHSRSLMEETTAMFESQSYILRANQRAADKGGIPSLLPIERARRALLSEC